MGMFRCMKCGKEFNRIFRLAWGANKCPKCKSPDTVMTGHY